MSWHAGAQADQSAVAAGDDLRVQARGQERISCVACGLSGHVSLATISDMNTITFPFYREGNRRREC